MITQMRERLKKEEGFTLVELMVVVLIIAILIAIAIPTFLGARERAQDRAAQSDLRNAMTAAKVHYVDVENYSDGGAVAADVTVAQLNAIEPSLTFVAGAPADLSYDVGFVVGPNTDLDVRQAIIFLRESAAGDWFCLGEEATGSAAGTLDGRGATSADVDTIAECVGGWTP